MKFDKIVARTFSVVLQPLLMPFYSVALLAGYTTFFYIYIERAWQILGVVLLFTFILPSLFILALRLFKVIDTFSLSDRNERFMVYTIACFSNMSLTYYFYSANYQIWFLALLAAPVLVIIVGAIINAFWRISAHMMGIGGVMGTAMSVCFNVNKQNPFLLFMVLFILAGCLGVSRLYLGRHTPAQIYAGFIAGFLAAFAVVWTGVYFSAHI